MSLQTTKWLTTQDLENFIASHADSKTKAAFIGVFPIDQLPTRIPHLPIIFIINTNSGNLPGQHWKAIYVDEKQHGEIFDSLATPISLRLERWMNTLTKKWIRSHSIIQHPLSPSCGAYVLYYVMTRLSSNSLDSVLRHFSINVTQNEKLVTHFISNMSL